MFIDRLGLCQPHYQILLIINPKFTKNNAIHVQEENYIKM